MAINWNRVGRTAMSLARRYGPRVAGEVKRQLDSRGRGALGTTSAPGGQGGPRPQGRPVATTDRSAKDVARRIEFAPELDGQADPGEIVWTWVEFEENDGRGKDRPVLVVGRDGRTLLGLMLSSQEKRATDPNWIGIGSGSWDRDGKPSYVRLDRVLDVPEYGIRREGAIADRDDFEAVAARLRAEYGWQ